MWGSWCVNCNWEIEIKLQCRSCGRNYEFIKGDDGSMNLSRTSVDTLYHEEQDELEVCGASNDLTISQKPSHTGCMEDHQEQNDLHTRYLAIDLVLCADDTQERAFAWALYWKTFTADELDTRADRSATNQSTLSEDTDFLDGHRHVLEYEVSYTRTAVNRNDKQNQSLDDTDCQTASQHSDRTSDKSEDTHAVTVPKNTHTNLTNTTPVIAAIPQSNLDSLDNSRINIQPESNKTSRNRRKKAKRRAKAAAAKAATQTNTQDPVPLPNDIFSDAAPSDPDLGHESSPDLSRNQTRWPYPSFAIANGFTEYPITESVTAAYNNDDDDDDNGGSRFHHVSIQHRGAKHMSRRVVPRN